MKIASISISGVAGIESLELEFGSQMNILCGPNGIGKTTILECIAHCFSHGQNSILKRNVNSTTAFITIMLDNIESKTFSFDVYEPNKSTMISGFHNYSEFLLSFKTTRTFVYKQLAAVSRDIEKQPYHLSAEASQGVHLDDIKNWFVNRHLFSVHENALTEAQKSNFLLAKKCFSVLNEKFIFSGVDPATLEIAVDSPGGKIYYEYLSSGFKSSIAILFGIIKEIEYRFPRTEARQFQGVVVLDEIELHLHPAWQGRLAKVLTEVFPHTQFIVTTHSPHVIQAAEPHEIIALEESNGRVELRELPESSHGFKGWTVDEVLTEVMGMTDTRTDFFNETMAAFEKAVDANDAIAAHSIFDKLDAALHPRNSLRKLLKIQLAGVGED